MKLTKRKAFKFYRSYYDVFNELDKDKDKLAFITALLDRQFLGVKPEGLEGMAKFAYISQINSIDSQVTGYEAKTGKELTPTQGGTQGGVIGGTQGGCLQEEEEEKEKVQYVIDFTSLLSFINKKTGRSFKIINESVKAKYKARLKDGYTKQDILNAITNSVETQYHKDNNYQYLTPEFFARSSTLDKYSFTPKDVSKEQKAKDLLNNF